MSFLHRNTYITFLKHVEFMGRCKNPPNHYHIVQFEFLEDTSNFL